jgi:tetratricopeptide (TPR) repeat protein
MADSALKEKHYFQAVKLFEQAKKGFLQLHGDSKNLCAKEQYYTVCYKQALAYFYMGHLVSSKKILEESLSTPADLELNKDAFNLRGLIQFKLGKFNLAKNDFEQSLKLYKAQNVIYLFKLFLTGDYRTLIKHLGYTRALGTEPFSSDEPWLTSELLQIYGEAFLKLDKYFEAIKMIDAAIKSLPNSAIYMIEKAKLTALLAFAYYKLSHEEYKEEEINISMLDGATRTISVKYFEESINQYIEQADSLLAEAKNLDSEDPRNKYVEDLIIEIKSNMEDFKPSVSLKT